MPTYPTYKLGDVAEIINGKNQKEVVSLQGEYPVYGSGGIIGWATDYLCKENSTIIGRKGTIDSPIFVNRKFWNVDTAFGIQPSERVLPRYLFFFCKSFDFKKLDKSTTIPSLAKRDLLQIPIPLPPLPTQQAIVARIEALFAELDKAAEHLRTAQQQLKIYRQAVLNHWLNNEDGKWEMVPIKEIISVISNGSTPKADKMFSKGEIQFLKVYNLNFDGSINLSKEPVFIERDTHEILLKRSQTKQGDVLINIVGPPLGKVSIIPEGEKEYNINQAIVMFRPNEFVTSKFLAYYLMSPQVIAWLTSTSKATAGQYNVKVSTCREIMFPKISISDQHRIVQEIESRLSQAEAAEASIAEALQKTEALRQSILKKAFSGELV